MKECRGSYKCRVVYPCRVDRLDMNVLCAAPDKCAPRMMRPSFFVAVSNLMETDKHTVKYVAIQHARQREVRRVLSIELDAAKPSVCLKGPFSRRCCDCLPHTGRDEGVASTGKIFRNPFNIGVPKSMWRN